jgi:hypothetical protein
MLESSIRGRERLAYEKVLQDSRIEILIIL